MTTMVGSDELKEHFDLEYWMDRESIAHKLGRGSSGMQLNVRECPACGDGRWRVYLNAETGLGNCFVCNQTFNKLGFVHQYLGNDPGDRKSWRQTFEHVKECIVEQGWRPKRMAQVAVAYEKAVFPNSFELPTPEGCNLKYLEDRGIDGALAKFFHLRFCERGWWKFKKEDGSDGFQQFGGRVIIPVYDLDGEFKTFQGRDITGLAGDKKYLFPKGLPGTGRYLLNGQSVQRAKRVVMGEGGFDVFALKKALDEEVDLRDVVPVGSFGKHLSFGNADGDDQLSRFRTLKGQGLEEVTIMWDGEHKALLAACDAAKLLIRIGLRARIALLPADRDPNEVTGEVVRRAFWEAVPYTTQQHIKWMLKNPFAP